MMIAVPGPRDTAIDTVRRILADTGASAPPVPVSAVTAVAAQGSESASREALQQRFAGRVITAQVIERIDAGSGIVDVDGLRVKVDAGLPPAGNAVMLRFVQAEGARLPVPQTLAGPASPAAKVTLGPVAQALSEVARLPPAALMLGEVPARVDSPTQFGAALAELVRTSGMFYESHLERWSRGQYPLEQLQREPQAAPAGAPAPGDRTAPQPHPGSILAGVAETAQPIVREQLGLLENRGASFLIQPWPGQQVQLDIVDERDQQAAAGLDPVDAAWITTLSLELPNLGRVHARLSLAGTRLQMAISADHQAQPRLSAGGSALRSALADAGISLTGLAFQHVHAQQ